MSVQYIRINESSSIDFRCTIPLDLLVLPVARGVPNTSEMAWILHMPQRTVSSQIRVQFFPEIVWNKMPMNVYNLKVNTTECQKADSFWNTQPRRNHHRRATLWQDISWWEQTKAKLGICEDIKRKHKCCVKCFYLVGVFNMKTRLNKYISLHTFLNIVLL